MDVEKFKEKRFDRYRAKFIKELKYDDTVENIVLANILRDALYYQFVSPIVKDYIKLFYDREDTFNKMLQRELTRLSEELETYSEYKFLIIGGAMLEKRTMYEKSHAEAWEVANEMIKSQGGAVLSVIAYELNGETTRAFENIEAMFKEPVDGVVRGSVVKDFMPDYKYRECECRKKKLERILKNEK